MCEKKEKNTKSQTQQKIICFGKFFFRVHNNSKAKRHKTYEYIRKAKGQR